MITTSREADYVINKIDGHVTIKELLDYAQFNVDIWLSYPVLWDLSNATMREEDTDYEAVRAIVGNISSLVEKRKGKKTTFVASDPFTYGMLRMAITIVESKEHCDVASVYSDIEEAKAWLKEA